jgi:hypothetical protein
VALKVRRLAHLRVIGQPLFAAFRLHGASSSKSALSSLEHHLGASQHIAQTDRPTLLAGREL